MPNSTRNKKEYTHYYYLGLPPKMEDHHHPFASHTNKDIVAAYRREARKYHPDKYTGSDIDRIKHINNAKDILLEKKKRSSYDSIIKSFSEKYADPGLKDCIDGKSSQQQLLNAYSKLLLVKNELIKREYTTENKQVATTMANAFWEYCEPLTPTHLLGKISTRLAAGTLKKTLTTMEIDENLCASIIEATLLDKPDYSSGHLAKLLYCFLLPWYKSKDEKPYKSAYFYDHYEYGACRMAMDLNLLGKLSNLNNNLKASIFYAAHQQALAFEYDAPIRTDTILRDFKAFLHLFISSAQRANNDKQKLEDIIPPHTEGAPFDIVYTQLRCSLNLEEKEQSETDKIKLIEFIYYFISSEKDKEPDITQIFSPVGTSDSIFTKSSKLEDLMYSMASFTSEKNATTLPLKKLIDLFHMPYFKTVYSEILRPCMDALTSLPTSSGWAFYKKRQAVESLVIKAFEETVTTFSKLSPAQMQNPQCMLSVHNQLVKNFEGYMEESGAKASGDHWAWTFFKRLLGIIIALPTLELAWFSNTYRGSFWRKNPYESCNHLRAAKKQLSNTKPTQTKSNNSKRT